MNKINTVWIPFHRYTIILYSEFNTVVQTLLMLQAWIPIWNGVLKHIAISLNEFDNNLSISWFKSVISLRNA